MQYHPEQWRSRFTLAPPLTITKNVSPPDPKISEALRTWASRPDKSIWLEIIDRGNRNQKIWGMSQYFRNGLRPIFGFVYQTIYENQAFTLELGQRVVAAGDRLNVAPAQTYQAGYAGGYHSMIYFLKYIVNYVINAELPFGRRDKIPGVVRKFNQLCEYALQCPDAERIRILCYFICKNPIVFDYRDGMYFLDKGWNLWMMHSTWFHQQVPMRDLNDYTTSINLPNDLPLYNIKMHNCDHRYGQRDYSPAEYEMGSSCFKFCMDVKRHLQLEQGEQFNTLRDIFIMITSVLPDVLPISFYEMAKELSQKSRFSGFVRETIASYIDFMEQSPRLILR